MIKDKLKKYVEENLRNIVRTEVLGSLKGDYLVLLIEGNGAIRHQLFNNKNNIPYNGVVIRPDIPGKDWAWDLFSDKENPTNFEQDFNFNKYYQAQKEANKKFYFKFIETQLEQTSIGKEWKDLLNKSRSRIPKRKIKALYKKDPYGLTTHYPTVFKNQSASSPLSYAQYITSKQSALVKFLERLEKRLV